MVVLLVILALFVAVPNVAAADQCEEKACINVYTDNNQIIIEARKGSTSVKKSISQAPKKTTVKPTPKPTVRPLFFPPATVKPVIKRPTVKRTYKPRTTKRPTKVNLSDRLTKLVPTAGVAYQPEFEPLVNVPVYFWCDLPSLFQSRVDIIGEVVDVALVLHLLGVLVMVRCIQQLKMAHLFLTAPSATPIHDQVRMWSHC